jgi:hypothetical protein
MTLKRYYTTRELSEIIGRSGQAINYWAKKLGVKGGGGRRKIYRYTLEDIEAIKTKLK